MRLRNRLALALAVLTTALAFPSVATAAETVINFDDQPANTTINNQYSAEGVTFDETPSGPTV